MRGQDPDVFHHSPFLMFFALHRVRGVREGGKEVIQGALRPQPSSAWTYFCRANAAVGGRGRGPGQERRG